MARVTVLVTCYNHLRHLPAALDSVFAQTFDDYEILAIDDGSTDGTREYLLDQGVTLTPHFNTENLGTYATLNLGFQMADTEWVAILNDDDVWAPTKLEEQIRFAEAHPDIPLIHTHGHFIDDSGDPVPGAPQGFEFPRMPTGERLPELVRRNQIIVSSTLVKRQTMLDLRGFDPTFYGYGDWHLWLRMARMAPVGFVDLPLTLYRVHAGQASRADRRMEEESLRIREWITTWEGEEINRDNAEAFAFNWRCIGASREMFGDRAGARAAYQRSLKLEPSLATLGRWALAPFSKPRFEAKP